MTGPEAAKPTYQRLDVLPMAYRGPCESRYGKPKLRWYTRDLAWVMAARVYLTPGGHLNVPYHCPTCNQYHLATAKNPRNDRRTHARTVIKRIINGGQINER